MDQPDYDVIIIGGSYAGLSAAMALGRSLRRVLIMDSGKPCNTPSPHSHNFITHDGESPKAIADSARNQVLKYDTVSFMHATALDVKKITEGFEVYASPESLFTTRKLLFATGITDLMPDIEGFADCWGKSVVHCPYCHGYEIKHKNIGVIGNGDAGFELCRLISNWTNTLTLFTNGHAKLTDLQTGKLNHHAIDVIDKEIVALKHTAGMIRAVVFKDETEHNIEALFARIDFKQHCPLPVHLGCELTAEGYLKTDDFKRTSVHGVYAAGDATTMMRAVSAATAAGALAGAAVNKELIEEDF